MLSPVTMVPYAVMVESVTMILLTSIESVTMFLLTHTLMHAHTHSHIHTAFL